MKRRCLRSAVILTLAALAPLLIVDTEEAAAPEQPSQASDIFSVGSLPRSANELRPRAPTGEDIPTRLHELLRDPNLPADFRDALAKNDFKAVGPAVMAEVPVVILLHISAPFLSTCGPRTLSAVVRRHPIDAVVARAVLAALDLVDDAGRTQFIRELGLNSGLSAEVQSAIGEAAVRWWGGDMTEHSMDLATVGTPLLAALPPGYLLEQAPDRAANLLMRLRNHPWEKPNDPSWSEQPPESRRAWMELFKKDPDSGKGQLVAVGSDGLNMLWAGATPDEINDLQYQDEDRESLIRLTHLTKLQTRGFLAKLYTQSALSSVELNDLFDWMLDFSPAGLQRFLANNTDFSNLPSADASRASVPTLKQVVEQVLASLVIEDRITNVADPGSWGRNLKDVGRLAYLLRADSLQRYSEPAHRLTWDVLAAIDTYKLSALQARYLTRGGEFLDLTRPLKELDAYHGLTRAIPTGKLAALRTSSVHDNVMLHLLQSIPATHAGRSATLFNKQRASLFVQSSVLEAVLRNPEPGQYLTLVSSHEVAAELDKFEEGYAALKSPRSRAGSFSFGDFLHKHINAKESIEKRLDFVPLNTLSAILGAARRNLSSADSRPEVWTSNTLLSPDRPLLRGALLGLSCVDVFALDLVDLPVVLSEFNRRLRASGLMFPKRLHYCLQRALEDYLDVKRRIRRGGTDMALVTFLEPSDIQAFGGFVLSTLKPEHILRSAHAESILSSIGALSPREILAAMRNEDASEVGKPPLGYAAEFALQIVDQHRARRSVGPRCLFALGNLHMFLPPDVISAIEPVAWRAFVEAAAGRPQSLTVCANGEQRDAWHRLLIKTFGSPSQWSAGVVAALGDVLAVLPADVLASIRVSSWRDAADTLAQRTVYHLPTEVHGSDYPLRFIDVCRSLLGKDHQDPFYWHVRRLVRYYLRAAQAQVDTVERADQLVRRLGQRSTRTRPVVQHGLRSAASGFPTTSTMSSTSTTTEAITTPSTTTTTTTEDPYFSNLDVFSPSVPSWMHEVLTSTSKPAPPPKTVIIQDDNGPAGAGEAATHSSATDAAPADATTTPVARMGKDLLVAWEEAKDKMPALSGTASTSSATSSVWLAKDLPMAVTLPTLTMYPNKSDGDSGAAIKLSDTTLKYAETTEEVRRLNETTLKFTETTVKYAETTKEATSRPKESVAEPETISVRRRRDADSDSFDEEMERQIERDVQMQVTCDAVRTLGAAASLALVQGDPEHMLDVDAEDCVEELSRLRLDRTLTRQIWSKLAPRDRSERISDLGSLVSAMSVDEAGLFNLSLAHENALDVLSVIGKHVQDDKVLDAVAEQLVLQNPLLSAVVGGAGGGKAHPDLDADSLLVALGPVACALPQAMQQMLLGRRGALLHAAHSLQAVRFHCNSSCLGELARAAVADAALGAPSGWTAEDVHDLGVIVAGLTPDQLQQLRRPATATNPEQPVSGLTASAVTCMTPDQILAIGDDLDKLSSVAASAVTPMQQTDLTEGQFARLLHVRHNIFTRQLARPGAGGHDQPDGGAGHRQAASLAALSLCLLFVLVLSAGRSL